jgi:hypothetical protein
MTYTPTIEAQIQDCIDRNERAIEQLQNIQAPPRSTPRFPAWAIALAAGLGFIGGFGLAGWVL